MSTTIENVVMEVKVRVKAKAFAQKDKKTMYSIMGFLLNLKEQGILDDEKVMECLEALPLYKTAAEKTAFFQLEMFDTKKVEDELYKPMVSDYKKAKKEKKVKKQGEVEEKKPRVKKVAVEGEVKEKKPRVKKVAVEGEVKEKKPRVKKVAVEGEPKRGRKPKEQIVELAQEKSDSHSGEEESLDMLIQSMVQKEEPSVVPLVVPLEEAQVEDVDDILRELEAEEIMESIIPVPVPLVSTPILKEKKKAKSAENKKEDKEKPAKKTKKSSV
jgi:hypothetical protein